MDKKLKKLKHEYKQTPIPYELDQVVNKALQQSNNGNRKSFGSGSKWLVSVAAALILFVLSVNMSTTLADSLKNVPILGSIVNVITVQEIDVENEKSEAHIKTPKINGLKDQTLANSLNDQYVRESKQLYKKFSEQVNLDQKGYFSVSADYQVVTDDDYLLSIEHNVEEIQASSYQTVDYVTLDKQREIVLTLPILFKDNHYIQDISKYIKEKMIAEMDHDKNKIYWVKGVTKEDASLTDDELFSTINANQSFYINDEHQLVIVFDQYDVAPGYMGVCKFTIPTTIIQDDLVGDRYIE